MRLIAISPGDPAGIGPEVCLKALSKNKKHYKKFVLIGDIDHFKFLNKKLDLNLKFKKDTRASGIINVRHIPLAAKVALGKPNTKNAKYILEVLFEASLGALNKKYSAVITGPINKSLINEYGFDFSGYSVNLAGGKRKSFGHQEQIFKSDRDMVFNSDNAFSNEYFSIDLVKDNFYLLAIKNGNTKMRIAAGVQFNF